MYCTVLYCNVLYFMHGVIKVSAVVRYFILSLSYSSCFIANGSQTEGKWGILLYISLEDKCFDLTSKKVNNFQFNCKH